MGRLKSLLIYLGIGIAAAGAGLIAANLFLSYHSRAEAEAENAELTQFLRENVRDIRVGAPFPDVPVWPANGGTPALLNELLPAGGVILYLTHGCHSCVNAGKAVDAALESNPVLSNHIVIVIDGDASGFVTDSLNHGPKPRVYADVQRSLLKDYKVTTFPSYFVIDENGTVKEFGTAFKDQSQLLAHLHSAK